MEATGIPNLRQPNPNCPMCHQHGIHPRPKPPHHGSICDLSAAGPPSKPRAATVTPSRSPSEGCISSAWDMSQAPKADAPGTSPEAGVETAGKLKSVALSQPAGAMGDVVGVQRDSVAGTLTLGGIRGQLAGPLACGAGNSCGHLLNTYAPAASMVVDPGPSIRAEEDVHGTQVPRDPGPSSTAQVSQDRSLGVGPYGTVGGEALRTATPTTQRASPDTEDMLTSDTEFGDQLGRGKRKRTPIPYRDTTAAHFTSLPRLKPKTGAAGQGKGSYITHDEFIEQYKELSLKYGQPCPYLVFEQEQKEKKNKGVEEQVSFLQCDKCNKWRSRPVDEVESHNGKGRYWVCGHCNAICDWCYTQPCDCANGDNNNNEFVINGRDIPQGFVREHRYRNPQNGGGVGPPYVSYICECTGCGKKVTSLDRREKMQEWLDKHRVCVPSWRHLTLAHFSFNVDKGIKASYDACWLKNTNKGCMGPRPVRTGRTCPTPAESNLTDVAVRVVPQVPGTPRSRNVPDAHVYALSECRVQELGWAGSREGADVSDPHAPQDKRRPAPRVMGYAATRGAAGVREATPEQVWVDVRPCANGDAEVRAPSPAVARYVATHDEVAAVGEGGVCEQDLHLQHVPMWVHPPWDPKPKPQTSVSSLGEWVDRGEQAAAPGGVDQPRATTPEPAASAQPGGTPDGQNATVQRADDDGDIQILEVVGYAGADREADRFRKQGCVPYIRARPPRPAPRPAMVAPQGASGAVPLPGWRPADVSAGARPGAPSFLGAGLQCHFTQPHNGGPWVMVQGAAPGRVEESLSSGRPQRALGQGRSALDYAYKHALDRWSAPNPYQRIQQAAQHPGLPHPVLSTIPRAAGSTTLPAVFLSPSNLHVRIAQVVDPTEEVGTPHEASSNAGGGEGQEDLYLGSEDPSESDASLIKDPNPKRRKTVTLSTGRIHSPRGTFLRHHDGWVRGPAPAPTSVEPTPLVPRHLSAVGRPLAMQVAERASSDAAAAGGGMSRLRQVVMLAEHSARVREGGAPAPPTTRASATLPTDAGTFESAPGGAALGGLPLGGYVGQQEVRRPTPLGWVSHQAQRREEQGGPSGVSRPRTRTPEPRSRTPEPRERSRTPDPRPRPPPDHWIQGALRIKAATKPRSNPTAPDPFEAYVGGWSAQDGSGPVGTFQKQMREHVAPNQGPPSREAQGVGLIAALLRSRAPQLGVGDAVSAAGAMVALMLGGAGPEFDRHAQEVAFQTQRSQRQVSQAITARRNADKGAGRQLSHTDWELAIEHVLSYSTANKPASTPAEPPRAQPPRASKARNSPSRLNGRPVGTHVSRPHPTPWQTSTPHVGPVAAQQLPPRGGAGTAEAAGRRPESSLPAGARPEPRGAHLPGLMTQLSAPVQPDPAQACGPGGKPPKRSVRVRLPRRPSVEGGMAPPHPHPHPHPHYASAGEGDQVLRAPNLDTTQHAAQARERLNDAPTALTRAHTQRDYPTLDSLHESMQARHQPPSAKRKAVSSDKARAPRPRPKVNGSKGVESRDKAEPASRAASVVAVHTPAVAAVSGQPEAAADASAAATNPPAVGTDPPAKAATPPAARPVRAGMPLSKLLPLIQSKNRLPPTRAAANQVVQRIAASGKRPPSGTALTLEGGQEPQSKVPEGGDKASPVAKTEWDGGNVVSSPSGQLGGSFSSSDSGGALVDVEVIHTPSPKGVPANKVTLQRQPRAGASGQAGGRVGPGYVASDVERGRKGPQEAGKQHAVRKPSDVSKPPGEDGACKGSKEHLRAGEQVAGRGDAREVGVVARLSGSSPDGAGGGSPTGGFDGVPRAPVVGGVGVGADQGDTEQRGELAVTSQGGVQVGTQQDGVKMAPRTTVHVVSERQSDYVAGVEAVRDCSRGGADPHRASREGAAAQPHRAKGLCSIDAVPTVSISFGGRVPGGKVVDKGDKEQRGELAATSQGGVYVGKQQDGVRMAPRTTVHVVAELQSDYVAGVEAVPGSPRGGADPHCASGEGAAAPQHRAKGLCSIDAVPTVSISFGGRVPGGDAGDECHTASPMGQVEGTDGGERGTRSPGAQGPQPSVVDGSLHGGVRGTSGPPVSSGDCQPQGEKEADMPHGEGPAGGEQSTHEAASGALASGDKLAEGVGARQHGRASEGDLQGESNASGLQRDTGWSPEGGDRGCDALGGDVRGACAEGRSEGVGRPTVGAYGGKQPSSEASGEGRCVASGAGKGVRDGAASGSMAIVASAARSSAAGDGAGGSSGNWLDFKGMNEARRLLQQLGGRRHIGGSTAARGTPWDAAAARPPQGEGAAKVVSSQGEAGATAGGGSFQAQPSMSGTASLPRKPQADGAAGSQHMEARAGAGAGQTSASVPARYTGGDSPPRGIAGSLRAGLSSGGVVAGGSQLVRPEASGGHAGETAAADGCAPAVAASNGDVTVAGDPYAVAAASTIGQVNGKGRELAAGGVVQAQRNGEGHELAAGGAVEAYRNGNGHELAAQLNDDATVLDRWLTAAPHEGDKAGASGINGLTVRTGLGGDRPRGPVGESQMQHGATSAKSSLMPRSAGEEDSLKLRQVGTMPTPGTNLADAHTEAGQGPVSGEPVSNGVVEEEHEVLVISDDDDAVIILDD